VPGKTGVTEPYVIIHVDFHWECPILGQLLWVGLKPGTGNEEMGNEEMSK